MSQLDLFLHAKATGRIFRFPCDHRVTFAHTVAQRLSSLDHDNGKKLWQEVCKEVRQGLRSEGRTAADIKGSIDRLADEVHGALKHLAIQKEYRSPAVILPLPGRRLPISQHGGGEGVAGALGRGTKFLVGLGEAHERTQYDAARAHEGGVA
jgi:hypothetical protein